MEKNKLHFIGIGGIGMSALATIALQRGARVSGSDKRATSITSALKAAGAAIHHGHAGANIPEDCTHVIYSTDYGHHPTEIFATLRALKTSSTHELIGKNCVKALGLNDLKSPHISNIRRLKIVQPRELSHQFYQSIHVLWTISTKNYLRELCNFIELRRELRAQEQAALSIPKEAPFLYTNPLQIIDLRVEKMGVIKTL